MAKTEMEVAIQDEVSALLADLRATMADKGYVNVPEAFGVLTTNVFLYLFTGLRFIDKDEQKLQQAVKYAVQFQRSGNQTGASYGIAPWFRFLFPEYSGFKDYKESCDGLQKFFMVRQTKRHV